MTVINATELFDRTDRAFVGLRNLAADAMKRSTDGVTTEWARLYAKGTAVGNANAVFRAQLDGIEATELDATVKGVEDLLAALIEAAEDNVTEAEDKVSGFRTAIAEGHVDGYKVARDYLRQEVTYFAR
jgi:hypothetical protein